MFVEVRPLETKKWHGKKGQEDFAQPMVIECLYDKATGTYATGLSEDDRKRLEKATGYDLSDRYDGTKPHPFWNSSTARIRLPHRTTVFNTNIPIEEIKVKVLKASKYVANSMKEWEEGKYPDATHVIYDEAEEMAIKATKIQKKNAATKIALEMSVDQKVNIIQIIKGKSLKNQSQDFVDVEIDNIINDNLTEFMELARADKARTHIKASILEAIDKNILTKEGNAVFYLGDRIGNDTEDAVRYFTDPQNQVMKASILEKLQKVK